MERNESTMLLNLILPVIELVFALFGSAGATNDTVRIEGRLISVSADGEVRIYKGIPFVSSPMGDLRWKAPQPWAAWEGKCDYSGPDCLQAPYHQSSVYFPPNSNSEYLGSYHDAQIVYGLRDTVQLRNHVLKAQLDFIDQFPNPGASREPRLD
jgi:hypothetical protein